ncbi:MAG: acyl-CoA dehydrogenase [Betaproteobacteria bacterium]|nr:acyl-CoA dehydrogenase [Betaproteobacteria bacterium]
MSPSAADARERGWPPLQPPLAGETGWVARARALLPMVALEADAIERERRLPPALLDALHGQRLFRLLLPRSVDGEELDPLSFFHVIETIARADASAAWCLCQAGGCAMAAAYLAPAVAASIFGRDSRAVLAWGPGPGARAVRIEGGYRVSGDWSFASGGRHATWLGAHCPVTHPDGTPVTAADGRRVERTLLVPAAAVQWTDTWNTVGLRGTASDRFSLRDHFVPEDHSITRDHRFECREPGPLYRLPANLLYQVGFAGVALGIARGALDAFTALAIDKVPRGQRSLLRDNAVVQSEYAQAEAGARAARAWLLQTVDELWREIGQPEARLSMGQRIRVRMASTHAIHQARAAVDRVWNAAGASAIFAEQPLERRFRDIHTVTQQLQGRLSHLETVGAWLLGADPDLTFV